MGKLYMNEELFGSDDSKDIKYDNSTSQIEADNVQGAIDYILENGTGNSSDMELTYAEYLKLSDEEKNNGTNYFIKDLGSSSSISCSNAEKGVIVKNGVWYCGGDSSGDGGGEITSTFKIESTTLYSGDTTSFPVALSDDINNYDLIKITFGWKGSLDSGVDGACEPIYQTPDRLKENTLFTFWDRYFIYFTIINKTFSLVNSDLHRGCLYSVEGLKFVVDSVGGGTSGSTSFEPVLLWEGIGANSVGQTLTMNQSIDDFDAVMVEGCLYINGEYQEQYTNNIIFKSSYYNKSQEPNHENWGLSLYNGNTSSPEYKHRIVGGFIDDKTLSLTAVDNAKLTKVYGLKFGSEGGSSSGVLPSKVKLKETTIFDAMSSPVGTSENYYSLIDNYDNYDMLELFYHSSSDHNNTGEMSSSLLTVAELKENNIRTFYGYGTRYIGIVFDKENTKQFRIAFNGVTGENSDKKWLLYKIVGIKFSGGGNSSGDSTESSQKILAIDTLYSEEEKIVGGWIDGKPIYQKTYSNNGNALTLPIDISNLNIDKLVNWEAACSNTQEYGPIMWTISSCSGIDGRSLYIQDNQIKTTGSYYRHFITIQFTKTTDEENSFTYDMIDSTEGLTDEQIVTLASETIAAAWPQ